MGMKYEQRLGGIISMRLDVAASTDFSKYFFICMKKRRPWTDFVCGEQLVLNIAIWVWNERTLKIELHSESIIKVFNVTCARTEIRGNM